jgi:hypothetical protein
MVRVSLVALPLLIGCNGKVNLSSAEARHTFDSLNRVSASTVIQALDAVLNSSLTSLKFDKKNLSISGTLGESEWSGPIDVDGRVEQTADTIGYNLTLGFTSVEMDDGAVFDGDIGLDFAGDNKIDLTTDITKLRYHADLAALGGLVVSGADRGKADLDYDVAMDLKGLAVNVTGKGDISGHDIAEWGEVLNLLGF